MNEAPALLYRGTPGWHEPGDVIAPGDGWMGRVYAATEAVAWDVLTLNHDSGYVYEVEPAGELHPDDEYDEGQSWWSEQPMTVVREVRSHGHA